MTNLRRHASSRISGSRRKSENSIGGFLSHGDPGERKSATPHSVEIPAPVNATASRVESTSDWSLALPSSTEATITSRLPQVWFDHPPLSPGLRPSGMTRTSLRTGPGAWLVAAERTSTICDWFASERKRSSSPLAGVKKDAPKSSAVVARVKVSASSGRRLRPCRRTRRDGFRRTAPGSNDIGTICPRLRLTYGQAALRARCANAHDERCAKRTRKALRQLTNDDGGADTRADVRRRPSGRQRDQVRARMHIPGHTRNRMPARSHTGCPSSSSGASYSRPSGHWAHPNRPRFDSHC